ncbi:MAG: carboxylate--amine ligase [Peptostreptococcaceae bacterium]|nr:carboxylate--amine ligase [Peptostreptococcaceae bacterium]
MSKKESKLGYYFRVFGGASLGKLGNRISAAHTRSGKSRVIIFFDMINSLIRYGAGYNDYVIFEFWDLNHKQRDTFLTRLRSKKLISQLNDPKFSYIFDDKNTFNKVFKDYIGREFIDVEVASKEEIIQYFNSREKIFGKMKNLSCGIGCELIKTEDYKNGEEFYKYVQEKGFATIEDVIENHPDINKLYPFSANTVRTITIVDAKGEAHCIYMVFKMGNNYRVVDNFGLHGPVDMETGEFLFPAHSGDTTAGQHFTEHPYSHIPLIGYKVPLIKETVELAKKAALVVPEMRYIGWDIAITPNGPAIIEGNNYNAHDFWQLPGQTPGGIGILPVLNELVPEFKY